MARLAFAKIDLPPSRSMLPLAMGVAGTDNAASFKNDRYTSEMDRREHRILDVASLVREAAAMNDAALALDLDESRFRAQLIAARADEAGYVDLALAAAHLVVILGPLGTTPSPGYGGGMLRVTNELDALGFDALQP